MCYRSEEARSSARQVMIASHRTRPRQEHVGMRRLGSASPASSSCTDLFYVGTKRRRAPTIAVDTGRKKGPEALSSDPFFLLIFNYLTLVTPPGLSRYQGLNCQFDSSACSQP